MKAEIPEGGLYYLVKVFWVGRWVKIGGEKLLFCGKSKALVVVHRFGRLYGSRSYAISASGAL